MKKTPFRHLLVVCDLEGSSACFTKRAAKFLNREWADACAGLTEDVGAVVTALFDAGAESVTVKDFHRTGHNLFTKRIDRRAKIISGYRSGTVPGMGNLGGIDAALFIGLHASSGSRGFLPHTLTSRIARLTAGGKQVCELQLFSAALSAVNIRPVFFSGCPVACAEAAKAVRGIRTFAIDKFSRNFNAEAWRKRLAAEAVRSLAAKTDVYNPQGPFDVAMTFRDGDTAAESFARSWSMEHRGPSVSFSAADMRDIYVQLTAKLYAPKALTPFLNLFLPLYNLIGRLGIAWAGKAAT